MLWTQPATTERKPLATRDKLTFVDYNPVRSEIVVELNGQQISLIVRGTDKFNSHLAYAKRQSFTVSFLEFIHGAANCDAAKLASALEEALNERE